MGKKKYIYQIIKLDSKYWILFGFLIVAIMFFDFIISITVDFRELNLLFFKYIVLILYFFLALTLPKKLPINFKRFVKNNPEIFNNKNIQAKFAGEIENTLNVSVERVFLTIFMIVSILFILIYWINGTNQYVFVGIFRGSSLILAVLDFITILLGVLFIISPFYFLLCIYWTIRMLGNGAYMIRVDYKTLRLDRLKD